MKKIVLLSLISLFAIELYSQEKTPVELDNSKLSLSFLMPGVQFEKKLSSNKSLAFQGSLDVNPWWEGSRGFSTSLRPSVQVGYRSYLNRKNVKKELANNSGNYLSGIITYKFTELENFNNHRHNDLVLGAVWGIQRNFKSGIHLDVNAGYGVSYGDFFGLRGTGILNFQLGFVIK